MDNKPCGCEAEKQYLEIINEVLPRLGEDAMRTFIQSGFSLPKMLEHLYYFLYEDAKPSQKYVGDKYVECILRMGRILTRKVTIPKDFLTHYKIAVYPRNHFVMGTKKDMAQTMAVQTITFEWDGRSKLAGMPVLDIVV